MNRIVLFLVWENCLFKKVTHILASISSLEIVESRLFDWKCTILLLKSSVRVRFDEIEKFEVRSFTTIDDKQSAMTLDVTKIQ